MGTSLAEYRGTLEQVWRCMLMGKIKVKGFGKLGTFGKLFPQPPLDRPITTEGARRNAG